jgi:hypothetical protein
MNTKRLVLTLLAPLALLPAAALAQPPDIDTPPAQLAQGYYDHTGRWHANEPNPYPDGYFDRAGHFHAYADAQPNANGYYDDNGNWVPARPTAPSGGYMDRDGNSVPQPWNGTYDRNPNWVPNAQGNGGYDYGRHDDAVPYGNGAYPYHFDHGGPDHWSYRDRGRFETLDVAARNLALTASSVARVAMRRSYDDRYTSEAFVRLDRSADAFARVTAQRSRGSIVGAAYTDLVNAYVDAQRSFGAVRPDRWLGNQFYVLGSAMGRLDRRYFGERAFGGRNPADDLYDRR